MKRLIYTTILAVCILGAFAFPAAASAYRMPSPPPYTVVYGVGPCGDEATGCAVPRERTVYMNDTLISPGTPKWAEVWWHERGHLVDAAFLDDRERGQFSRMLGHRRRWRASDDTVTVSRTGEQFATAYMMCRLRRRFEPDKGEVFFDTYTRYQPGHRLYRRVCRWMETIDD